MKMLSLPAWVVFLCILSVPAFGQQPRPAYAAGYREYRSTDSSRRYRPGATPGDRLYYRPEAIDVWYPATVEPNKKPLDFAYFLNLFENRANTFQDSVKYTGLAKELLQHFTIGGAAGTDIKTNSFLNPMAAGGRFPLIVYLSSYNGMSYENVPLFEDLAQQGYVVAVISSVGRYPGNMSTRYPDALEQAGDAEFALHFLKSQGADTTQVGLAAYSWGGIAAALVAMQHPTIKAMLSLDGSERHYYGRDKDEDKDFNALRSSPHWKTGAIKAAYCYLESDHKQDDGPADSCYLVAARYARLTGATHDDFSGISALAGQYGIYQIVRRLTLAYFDQWLKEGGQSFDTVLKTALSEGKIAFTPQAAPPKTAWLLLTGNVTDGKGMPLPYASIGIPSGNCGTVADGQGHFFLRVPDTLSDRTVRISSLGYQPQTYQVKDLMPSSTNKRVVRLQQQVNQLAEVNISGAKTRSRIIGNTSQSKFFNVGFPLKDLGSEVGIKVSLGKKKILFSKFNFNISNTRMDSCTFRLNVYALEDGMPAENLLTQNIVTGIGNKPGSYSIDLLPYHILLNGTVLVALEWIGGKPASGNGAVFFSASLLSSSYHRKTSEADWVKFNGLGAAFNLKVVEE